MNLDRQIVTIDVPILKSYCEKILEEIADE